MHIISFSCRHQSTHAHKRTHKCTHTRTNSHSWHYVCLNNRFLVHGAGLLRVWLEPLGDLSVRAMRAGNPSKFALSSRGTHLGPLNSWPWYALCFNLWTLTPEMNDTHAYTHTDENVSTHICREKVYIFKKKVDALTHTAWSLFQAFPNSFKPLNRLMSGWQVYLKNQGWID